MTGGSGFAWGTHEVLTKVCMCKWKERPFSMPCVDVRTPAPTQGPGGHGLSVQLAAMARTTLQTHHRLSGGQARLGEVVVGPVCQLSQPAGLGLHATRCPHKNLMLPCYASVSPLAFIHK